MGRQPALLLVVLAGAALLVAPSLAARADTPLPPPERKVIWSPDRTHCADMDPRSQVTTVYRVEAGDKRVRLWAMVGWNRGAALANDGEHLVLCHPGLNLLPLEVRDDDVLLWFVRRGELVATVALLDLVPRTALRRTASHWLWGSFGGIDDEGRYVVQTVDERIVRFDVATGRAVP